jgi:hypothetical protein
MGRYSDEYLDELLARSDEVALAELQAILFSWHGRDTLQADYGLPSAIFVYVETVTWFAQAIRSGAWTYYEATPLTRQQAMREALGVWAPQDYAEQYGFGMSYWKDKRGIDALDKWMREREESCNDWLMQLLRRHREKLALLNS